MPDNVIIDPPAPVPPLEPALQIEPVNTPFPPEPALPAKGPERQKLDPQRPYVF